MFVFIIAVAWGASPSESKVGRFITAMAKEFPTMPYDDIREAAEVYFPFGDIPKSINDVVHLIDTTTTTPTTTMPRREMMEAVFAIADSNPLFTRSQISEAFSRMYPQVVPGLSEGKVEYMLYFRNMRLNAGEKGIDSDDDSSGPERPRRRFKGLARKLLKEEMIKAGGFQSPLNAVVPPAVRQYAIETGGHRIKYPSMARYYGRVRKELIEEAKAGIVKK